MFYLYILYSRKLKQLYVGQTKNLEQRLQEHRNGQVFSTKGGLPLSLIHTEKYFTRSEVIKRERFFKSLSGSKLKKKILEKFLADGSSKL